jgi:hypothetical protein
MKTGSLSAFVLVVCLATQSLGYLRYSPQRLDHVICAKHDPKLIVAGQIQENNTTRNVYPPDTTLTFKVEGVILGEIGYVGQGLEIPAASIYWPQELVPFKKGIFCILVLRPPWQLSADYFISAVVSASAKPFEPVGDGGKAKRVLAKEILSELKEEKSPKRQRALMLQVAPILIREEAPALVPFLKSEDPWVRRAALAGLIYATEDDEYLMLAADDFQDFFATTERAARVDAFQDGGLHSPYWLFFNNYFFLEKRTWRWGSRWNEEEADKHLRIIHSILESGIIDEETAAIIFPEPTDWPSSEPSQEKPVFRWGEGAT